MTISTPEWVKNAIFYQIFPDRFARSSRLQHPKGITFKPWGSPPQEQGFQGGDLLGIVDKLDYLQELGITALYLNPIFASASNHRYHTYDYFQVDPLLGGNKAFRTLLDEAHARNIRVVLDGVFNHASRGFWPFHHVLESGENSPYLDWFIIHDWPLRPYSSDKDNPANYEAWFDLPALPKFNTNNPGVRDYIMKVARYWLEFGIDGWRLDVPNEIDDDSFWQEFRQVVKSVNPEAYICGEIWHESQRWLQGDQFDAVMNYVFANAAVCFFGADSLSLNNKPHEFSFEPLDVAAFAEKIEQMHALYDWEINYVQLNLLDSHDMPRFLTMVNEDISALRLSVLFQMTMPGAPCIYYGDEIGLTGGQEPDCRKAFPWETPELWNDELLDFYRQAIAMRNRHPVLRKGDFQLRYSDNGIYVFQRELDLEHQLAMVIFNTRDEPTQLEIKTPDNKTMTFVEAWPDDGAEYQLTEYAVTIVVPEREAMVLIAEVTE